MRQAQAVADLMERCLEEADMLEEHGVESRHEDHATIDPQIWQTRFVTEEASGLRGRKTTFPNEDVRDTPAFFSETERCLKEMSRSSLSNTEFQAPPQPC